MPIELDVEARRENFDERGYLLLNEDVAKNVDKEALNRWRSGLHHFEVIGHSERRQLRQLGAIEKARALKITSLEPHLLKDMTHTRRGLKYDFLSSELKIDTAISETHLVSAHRYDTHVIELIDKNHGSLILDCGAGLRPVYYDNVVNYDIVDYETTDVIGVAEALPFKSGTFDGIISIAVLEHVRDPFKCASELMRALKSGGRIVCAVPLLAPYHGYPHHYFNMTHQGIRALFGDALNVEFHEVIDSLLPIWALTWIVQSWADGLTEDVRNEFLGQPVRALMENASTLVEKRWVRELPRERNFDLACGTLLIGQKR